MRELFKGVFGSHLYGTNLPTSDMDYKIVYLPSKRHLLLGKPIGNSVVQTNTQGKNKAGDEDTEYIAVHTLVKDFVKGQTYALEVVFHPDIDALLTSNLPSDDLSYLFAVLCMDLRTKCLTKDVTALVGYCKGQARRYSSKGDKVNALKEVLDALHTARTCESTFSENSLNLRVSEIVNYLPTHDKYLKFETDELGNEYYNVCGAQHQMSIRVGELYERVQKEYDTYGHRAKTAASLDGADWKALMHAARVTMEAKQVLSTGKITFPFEGQDLSFLMQIRKGELDLDYVSGWLEGALLTVTELEEASTLPTQAEAMEVAEELLYTFVLKHA